MRRGGSCMLEKTGVADYETYEKVFPEDEDVLKAPKAIIECYKEIPCNPCETSCPFSAITIGENINKRPVIDFNRCTGCAICASVCPGLAISIRSISGKRARLTFPYEFLPRPEKGKDVNVVDREGNVLTTGMVLKVQETNLSNKTAMITVEVNKVYLYDAAAVEVAM